MILDQFCLKGKIALVTGANDGIGQAIAVGPAEAGADIAQSTAPISPNTGAG